MVKQLANVIPGINGETAPEWDKWVIFFCDERIVEFSDKESTFGEYKAELLSKVPELESRFEAIDPSKNGEFFFDLRLLFSDPIRLFFIR